MTTKYLKALSFDEAKIFLFQDEEISQILKNELWDKNKISGPRMVQLVNGHDGTTKKTKAGFGLDDNKMECLINYLKANYPEANFTAGLPGAVEKTKTAASTKPVAKTEKIQPKIVNKIDPK